MFINRVYYYRDVRCLSLSMFACTIDIACKLGIVAKSLLNKVFTVYLSLQRSQFHEIF